jgi:hypothetical protein
MIKQSLAGTAISDSGSIGSYILELNLEDQGL